jgi:hypothetical protein
MIDDPAHDRITAILAAITGLVTGPPNLVGFRQSRTFAPH